MRQLLHYIKAFRICQQLFYFFFAVVKQFLTRQFI